jgi:ATP-dependent Lhr-like helicase
MANMVEQNASVQEQLEIAVKQFCGQAFPASWWENIIFARRVKGYRENLLDQFLAKGDYFWQFCKEGRIAFKRYEDIDWEQEKKEPSKDLTQDEQRLYQELSKRGASFMRTFNNLPLEGNLMEGFLSLAAGGYVCADSFLPVRQWMNLAKIKKASPRSRVNARMLAMSAGRWDLVRPLKKKTMEEWVEQLFSQTLILCRETYSRPEGAQADQEDTSWSGALEVLRIWEYTGKVRRGYYVAGMSGAQFVRAQDYDRIVLALKRYGGQEQEKADVIWLNAADPCQVWGKALADQEVKSFMNLPGTLVALSGGIPVVVLQRQGKVLRFLENSMSLTEDKKVSIMKAFVLLFQQKRILAEKRNLAIKEYPDEARLILEKVGFRKEVLSYVLYR